MALVEAPGSFQKLNSALVSEERRMFKGYGQNDVDWVAPWSKLGAVWVVKLCVADPGRFSSHRPAASGGAERISTALVIEVEGENRGEWTFQKWCSKLLAQKGCEIVLVQDSCSMF